MNELDHSSASRRLTLVIPTLAFGGAERVMARLANHWAELGCDVTLITLASAESDTYPLDPRIRRIGLGVMCDSTSAFQAMWRNVGRIRALRRAIREARPDVVVSFTDQMNVTTLLATRVLGLDVIVAERSDPRHQSIGRLRSQLRRWLYPRAKAVVVQTKAVRDWMSRFVPPHKLHVIPNAVETPRSPSGSDVEQRDGVEAAETAQDESPIEGMTGASQNLQPRPPRAASQCAVTGGRRPPDDTQRRIVALGRLSTEKGFDLLIDAFARVAARHPDWTLHIAGNGPARGSLLQQIESLGLEDRVQLHEWTPDSAAFLQQGDLFVLPSRYEGFPNALLEAMACGVPVVSFDCDSGPDEIIRHGVDGLLVPKEDSAELARAVERLITDDAERPRLGSRAREVVERFGLPQFFRRWDDVVVKSS